MVSYLEQLARIADTQRFLNTTATTAYPRSLFDTTYHLVGPGFPSLTILQEQTARNAGFSTYAEQQEALRQAIIDARQANPQYYQNIASDYLANLVQNGVLSKPDIQSILPSINLQTARGLSFFQNLLNAPSGQSSLPTGDSGGVNPPPSSAPGLGSQIQSAGAGIKAALGGTGLIIGGLIILAVVLRK